MTHDSIRRRIAVSLACVMAVFLPALPAASQATRDLRDPRFMARALAGFDQLRNLDYESGIETFSALEKDHPDHPAPPMYLAISIWLRELFERQELDLENFVDPSHFTERSGREMPAADRERFLTLMEKSQSLSQARLEREPGHPDARYFLGASRGALAAFALTIEGSARQALGHGKEAFEIHRDLVEDEPDYHDAYMTLGMYEYITDNLPWYIKWIAVIAGYRGSEERGFQYLHRVVDHGRYVTDDARVLLMVLYVREEEYAQALEMAQYLHQHFPRNFLFHLNRAQILERMERHGEAFETYQDVLERAEDGVPNYTKVELSDFRISLARKFMDFERWGRALEEFIEVIEDPNASGRQRVLAHLHAGQTLDAMDRRTEAVAHYQRVLELEDHEDAHNRAEDLLDEPFREEQ